MEIIRTYESEEGYVEYSYIEGKLIIGVHTYEGYKYSIKMLREMIKISKKEKEFYGSLPYKYLIDFYEKHFKLTLIQDTIYKFERK